MNRARTTKTLAEMVIQQRNRSTDLSLLIRDSLKSFNRLKCAIDDIGADVKPFYENTLRVDQSNSLEQQYYSALKYHSLSSTQSCYGIGADSNLHQLDTFKRQNERYLDELVDYLVKNKNNQMNKKRYNACDSNLTRDRQYLDLIELVGSVTECSGMPSTSNIFLTIEKNTLCENLSYLQISSVAAKTRDNGWEKFKSDFVSRDSEYYFQINAATSKSYETSFSNITPDRLHVNNDYTIRFSKDKLNKKLPSSTPSSALSAHTLSSVQSAKLDITVFNPHNILLRDKNLIASNISLNISLLEFLYIEQVILFNNSKKSIQTNLIVIDSQQKLVLPTNQTTDKAITEGEITNDVVPYATFVSLNFDGYVQSNNTMLVDNWLLLGRQLYLMRDISKTDGGGNATTFRQTQQFRDIIISTSWNHLCLKEKRRLVKLTPKNYSLENTTDIIYCYYCNKDKFCPRSCSSMKESILWKCIYSSIRCGDMRAAAMFAEGLHLENVVFIQYMNAFANNHLDNLKELRDALLELYTFEDDSKLTIKRLVLSLLLDNMNDIDVSLYFQSFDDLLWFRLCKSYFYHDEQLSHLQNDINEIILTNFKNDSHRIDPLAIVQALLYCGNYVSCINYLCDFPSLSPHMINLAIAMFLEGVILLDDTPINNFSSNNFLMNDLPDVTSRTSIPPVIHIKDIFLRYIQNLSDINVELATEYIYIFKDHINDLVIPFMTQIALVTSNISRLFGNILPDGTHTDGLVNLFENHAVKILNPIARTFEKNNDLYNAIRIYDLSKSYKKVVKLTNKMLCETICLSWADRKRKKICETANFIFSRMLQQSWNIDISQQTLFEFLHDYLLLEDLMKNNDLISTLEVADNCRFIPNNSESLYDFQKLIKNLPPIAFRFLGTFIRAVATLFYHQYVATVDPHSQFSFRNQNSFYIKNKMKSLVRMVTQMCDDSIIPSDAMQAVLLMDNKIIT